MLCVGMADEHILIACYLHGKLSISANNELSYKGGDVLLFPIWKASNFQELLSEIYTVSGVSEEEFEFKIIWNSPVFEKRTVVVPIRNDREWANVFVVGSRVVLVKLFVEKYRKEQHETHEEDTLFDTQEEVPNTYVFASSSPYMACRDSQG